METKGSNTVHPAPKTVCKKRKSPKQGKKKSPKQRKMKSPQGAKPRAQWNILLEKSLVEILHEHDTPYHRGQNGWSGESWSAMVDMFHRRNPHVRFDKSQVHDKEKELKRDYRMLKDALGQSGVGWNESKFMLDAEPHLWDNLAISFGPRILKFKKKPFPLYETLANLYHKHTAEGNFNFTSTADQKPHMDIETDSDDDDENRDADFEILEQPHVEHVQDNQVNQRQVGLEAGLEHVLATQTQASVTSVEANQRNGAGPSTNKPRKRKSSPKMKPKSTGDALVGVIDRFVNIKEKEVNNEAAQQFTISKCIAALRTLEGFDPAKKPKAFVVFKSVDNREIFLSSVEDNDGSALAWLNGEMAMLP
ncbi:uncharacterized protein [Lolium perenne]|uniref:uncharacterized protein n=1 Tax=Lolium perenne TaxID=4522 RepID=UPI003A996567